MITDVLTNVAIIITAPTISTADRIIASTAPDPFTKVGSPAIDDPELTLQRPAFQSPPKFLSVFGPILVHQRVCRVQHTFPQ